MKPQNPLGAKAEELAAKLLARNGFKILGRNVRLKIGEIDILAQDNDTIVIVEVKAKSGPLFGRPVDMVDRHKQRKLWQLGQIVSLRYPGKNVRIDVVAADYSADPPKLEHIRNTISI